MQYELRWFDRIIDGDLCPLQVSAEKQVSWQNYLQKQNSYVTKQFALVGTINPDGDFRITSNKVKILGSQVAAPWVELAPNFTDNDTLIRLINEVVPVLSIQSSEVSYAYYWQNGAGTHLELYVRQDVKRLTPEELRFVYYLCQLEERTKMIKDGLTNTVFSLASDKKAKKYVQNHQRVLIELCSSTMQYLNEEDRQHIYCLSEQLTASDIYKMIFRSLEDIVAHLEQHFAKYLDTTAYVTYRSRIISFAQMVEKFSAIQQALRQSTIAPELLAVLDEPFQELESLKSEPATYRELLYYKKFIQELGCLVEREQISDYHVAETLFQINFNSSSFLSWLMSRLDWYVGTETTINDKLEVLYHYRKLSKQVVPKTSQTYQPKLPAIDGQIQNYIEEDIERYQQRLYASSRDVDTGSQEDPAGQTLSSAKIPTPLSVKQLAYLLRLFFEVRIFPPKDGYKASFFRLFESAVSTVGKQNIAEGSLYNRQYRPNVHTKEVVREKLQAMINFIRKDED